MGASEIFTEMHRLSHDNDLRYEMLMRGVRRLLKMKQEQGFVKRAYTRRLRRNKPIKVEAWK